MPVRCFQRQILLSESSRHAEPWVAAGQRTGNRASAGDTVEEAWGVGGVRGPGRSQAVKSQMLPGEAE